MSIGQFIDRVEEGKDLTIVLKETDNRLIKTRQFLIGFITTGVVGATAVKDITATIATLVLRDTFAIGKTEHPDHQRSLRIIFREGSRTILRMSLIRVEVGGLIAIGSTSHGLYLLELWKLGELSQNLHQIRIMERRRTGEEFPEVLDGRWNGFDEVLLLFKVASEAIGSKHLKGTEEHKERQAIDKMSHRWHLNIIFQ